MLLVVEGMTPRLPGRLLQFWSTPQETARADLQEELKGPPIGALRRFLELVRRFGFLSPKRGSGGRVDLFRGVFVPKTPLFPSFPITLPFNLIN